MALVEIDQVAIKKELWDRVKGGDIDALAEARKFVDGMEVYMHALPVEEDEVIITLRDLETYFVVESVKIEAAQERT